MKKKREEWTLREVDILGEKCRVTGGERRCTLVDLVVLQCDLDLVGNGSPFKDL